MSKTEEVRMRFRQVAAAAEQAIKERRSGRFFASEQSYINISFWKGRLTMETVGDELLLATAKRVASLPPFVPGSREALVSVKEREALKDFVERGPRLLLERLREAMSEALKSGLSRSDIAQIASSARRTRARR